MDRGIHEGIQSQRAAAFERLTPFEERIDRRAGQRQYQQGDGVTSRPLFQFLNRVGGNVASQEIKENVHKGRPGIHMHGDLKWGVASEDSFHWLIWALDAIPGGEWRPGPL